MEKLKTNLLKNSIFLALYAYLIVLGLLSSHFHDHFLSILWLIQVVLYLIAAIFLRKYLFILLFLITSALVFPMSYNPYSYYIIESGVIEKTITNKGKTIFIIKFSDNSTATVLYEEKQCFGREYQNKANCHLILWMLESGHIH